MRNWGVNLLVFSLFVSSIDSGGEAVAIGNTSGPIHTHVRTDRIHSTGALTSRQSSDGDSPGGTYRGLGVLSALIIHYVVREPKILGCEGQFR